MSSENPSELPRYAPKRSALLMSEARKCVSSSRIVVPDIARYVSLDDKEMAYFGFHALGGFLYHTECHKCHRNYARVISTGDQAKMCDSPKEILWLRTCQNCKVEGYKPCGTEGCKNKYLNVLDCTKCYKCNPEERAITAYACGTEGCDGFLESPRFPCGYCTYKDRQATLTEGKV